MVLTIMYRSLENVSSLSYTDLPNVGILHSVKKTVNITDRIIGKFSLKEYWKVVKFKVEKTSFYFRKLEFYSL